MVKTLAVIVAVAGNVDVSETVIVIALVNGNATVVVADAVSDAAVMDPSLSRRRIALRLGEAYRR